MSDYYGRPGYVPVIGDLVRYGGGSTALAIVAQKHAGGWHGRQCMGGATFIGNCKPASDVDKRTWVACATWRNESHETAAAAIGFDLTSLEDDPAKRNAESMHVARFTDTPIPAHDRTRDGPTPGPRLATAPVATAGALRRLRNAVYAAVVAAAVLGGAIGYGLCSLVHLSH